MFAAHKGLGSLTAFVDSNKQQLDGWTNEVMDTGEIADKFESFGWHTQEIDGHDIGEIMDALSCARETRDIPSVIILDTVKGNGVSFAAGVPGNHHMAFAKEQMDKEIQTASERLESALAALN